MPARGPARREPEQAPPGDVPSRGNWLPSWWLWGLTLAIPVLALRSAAPEDVILEADLHEHYSKHPEEIQSKLPELLKDEVLGPVLRELASNGPEALARYQHDETVLRRFSEKLGGVPPGLGSQPSGIPTGLEKVDARDERGMTSLAWAAARGHVPVVQQLLEARADARAVDNGGNSVLHFAAGYGRAPVVALLAERLPPKAVHEENAEGRTPVDVARANGHDVSKILKGFL
mmetsp:Transcript_32680/g.75986  ORF Transcript_32680/g.75986 Transcript_32680/m.75986 type:complete len:232 (+) Transcript_32680:26-721(+)